MFYKFLSYIMEELRFVVCFGGDGGEGGKYFIDFVIYFVKF